MVENLLLWTGFAGVGATAMKTENECSRKMAKLGPRKTAGRAFSSN